MQLIPTLHWESYICALRWAISSVGLEHYLDKVGVTGSNPVLPTLPICQLRLARQDIMAIFRTSAFLLLAFLLTNIFTAMADVGTRHMLLHERNLLHRQLERLSKDSSAIASHRKDSLQDVILDLDSRIFASYDETLSRLSAQQRRRATNDRALTIFALLCCLVALGSVLALWLAHSRINNDVSHGLPGLYRQLFRDFILTVRPEKASSPVVSRVSPVVILGVLGMMVSIVVYLISSLR